MRSKPSRFIFTLFTVLSLLPGCKRNIENAHDDHPQELDYSIIKIAAEDDPSSLDPRRNRDLTTVTSLRMFYDGLMRSGPEGIPTPAIAEKVIISPDMKQYTFTLKNTLWSDGTPLTAQDFERSWKKVLDPQFPAPNAYQFYVIKGAQAAKEGKGNISDVGIKAIDPKTLLIDLENPTPYFLELTTFHPFFPVNDQWDKDEALSKNSPTEFISNGPFKLKKWAHHNVLVGVKNPFYWNAPDVKLDEIQLMTLDPNTALQMFEAGSLDWTGSPLSHIPSEAIPTLRKMGAMEAIPAAGTNFFRFNIEKAPFNKTKMRQAFSYAISRKEITEHVLQGGQRAALSFVPTYMGLQGAPYFQDEDLVKARALFDEALTEMGISKEELPPITLLYANNDNSHKLAQAIQQQWNLAFDIDTKLERLESKVYFDKLSHKDYQISAGSWFADFNDPINFLEVFKFKTNPTNNTEWENPEYVTLLNLSALEADPQKRKKILRQAEAILLGEMPIIPLFYYSFEYVKKEPIDGVYFSELGYLDFSHASIIYPEIYPLPESVE